MAFVMILGIEIPVMAEDIAISYEKLPVKARKVVSEVYPDTKVKKVKMERRASFIEYEVKLEGGVKLQFSKDGTFTECEVTKGEVPSQLIPEKIREQVKAEFPERKVMCLEHDNKLYELRLDNGDELSFNSSYRLIDIDRFDK